MFGQAWSDCEQVVLAELPKLPQAPRAAIRRSARVFFDFMVANPARHQLMNQRTIPGFEPSADSYAPAVRVLELGQQLCRDLGLTDPADFDIGTAIIDGLINQQLANDPGGTRWSALLAASFRFARICTPVVLLLEPTVRGGSARTAWNSRHPHVCLWYRSRHVY